MRNRKRKQHIMYGGYGVCGAYLDQHYDFAERRSVVRNGRTMDEIKSLCYVTCKSCRKTWNYATLVRRVKDKKKIGI